MRRYLLPVLAVCLAAQLVSAAPAAAAPALQAASGTTLAPLNLRPEPGTARPPLAVIPIGTTLAISGRNAAATWLATSYQGQPGWVYAPFVALTAGTVRDLPVVGQTPAPPPTPAPGAAPAASGYSAYLHNITPRARQIFLDGRARGSRPDVFSKVGDSITASWAFLNKIGDGVYDLHEYAYLAPVIAYYSGTTARTGNSFNNASYSAVEGWTAADLLDPVHAAAVCPGLGPLACEYSAVRPAVAIIMIGTNDAGRWTDRGAYAANLARIVETSLQYGVIPVLSTIPHIDSGDAPAYNAIIVATAAAYEIPWMDFYAATVNLPNHGNDPDGVHPAVPPTHDPTNFTPETLQYGFTVRNLLTLHMLDALWRQTLTP